MSIPILKIRKALGRADWRTPEPHGPDGWRLVHQDGTCSIIISAADWHLPGGPLTDWIHASRTGPGRPPTWAELQELHVAVWGGTGYSYQVHPPADQHVNIHPDALHLWGRADGKPVLPEFGKAGTI